VLLILLVQGYVSISYQIGVVQLNGTPSHYLTQIWICKFILLPSLSPFRQRFSGSRGKTTMKQIICLVCQGLPCSAVWASKSHTTLPDLCDYRCGSRHWWDSPSYILLLWQLSTIIRNNNWWAHNHNIGCDWNMSSLPCANVRHIISDVQQANLWFPLLRPKINSAFNFSLRLEVTFSHPASVASL